MQHLAKLSTIEPNRLMSETGELRKVVLSASLISIKFNQRWRLRTTKLAITLPIAWAIVLIARRGGQLRGTAPRKQHDQGVSLLSTVVRAVEAEGFCPTATIYIGYIHRLYTFVHVSGKHLLKVLVKSVVNALLMRNCVE